MTVQRIAWPPPFLAKLRQMRRLEEERARTNPFLAQALENEKTEGHRIAVIARTTALGLIALVLPFLNPTISVLYAEALLLAFIAIGWAQLSFARVGHSRVELGLIFADLALLTFVCVTPNPLLNEEIPSAFVYRFDGFIAFFVILAVGTLAYSWRTVWVMGVSGSLLWLVGLLGVLYFGHRIPELSEASAAAFSDYPLIGEMLDPNNAEPTVRVWEMLVFAIVAGILTLKGWRSNQLLLRQAEVAAERANLSRYFPKNLVDELASSEHDVGAVRSQEIAVLFTDIVGFTEVAEHNPPKKVMALLRSYHAIVEGAIFENGGTLDKYLGDGVMATFGTPDTGPEDAANAVKAARQLLVDMDQFRRECTALVDVELQVSVGVHFGPVIVGDIGPPRRLEFAVVGDTVNVASRLEAATRELDCRCVVSDALVQKVKTSGASNLSFLDDFTARKNVQLRGRRVAVDIWIA